MATEHEDPGLASSFTDLMTSLAVIFILLLVATTNNARVRAKQQTEATRIDVLNRLQHALDQFTVKGQRVRLERDRSDPLVLNVLLPEALRRFALNSSIVPKEGRAFLKRFIPVFVGAVCEPKLHNEISSIVIDGHTSPDGPEEHNLELSQERSMAVLEYSLTVLDELQPPNAQGPSREHDCFVAMVSAAGRGSVHPLHDKNGAIDLSKSRRVFFKIRVKSSEQREFASKLGLPAPQGTGTEK